jgi:hypothetical protein
MTQLRFSDPSELRDALLFFARLEHRQLQANVEGRFHTDDYRTIVLGCQSIYSIIVLLSSLDVLTPNSTRRYGNFLPYDEVVEDFGRRLRRVRDERGLDGTTVARNALGPHGSAKQYRDFANYLSRIERKNANVSHEKLTEIAKGLGFPSMSVFWQAIEQAGNGHGPAGLALPTPPPQVDNRPSSQREADHDDHALSTMDLQSIERIFFGATDKIVAALESVGARLAASRPPDSPPRTKTPRRRRAAGARPRKTA